MGLPPFLFWLSILYRVEDKSQQLAINNISFCGYNLAKRKGGAVVPTEDICLQDMGRRITERRKKLGLTQEALAELGDLSPQFVSLAESGKRAMRPENLLKISRALGVSADYLLTGELVDKDHLLLSDELRRLTPTQFLIVKSIVDECNALYRNP